MVTVPELPPEDKSPVPSADKEGDTCKQVSMGAPFSLGINLVVSVLVAMAMGYGLDSWLGTKPWLMLLFIFLGFAAGIRRIMQQMDK